MENLISLICESPLNGVYVFGSWLRRKDAHDVDLLIVYNPTICPVESAISLRKEIGAMTTHALGLPAHILLLTVTEEEQVDFCAAESCVPFVVALVTREAFS